MKTNQIIIALILAVTTLISGCASTQAPAASSSYSNVLYGVVESIEGGPNNNGGLGAGAVIGGVVGGVLGSQIGGGHGNEAATVAGVVAGAMVGHEIEKKQQQPYRVRVRLDNRDYVTITQQNIGDMRVGDRVRIENNYVSRY